MKKSIGLYFFVMILLFSGFNAMAADAPAPSASGVRAELLAQLDDAGKKLVDLAQAVPAEKYSWRPGEGVRSIGEVFVHVAGGNFLLPQFIGVQPPGGLPKDMEKTITDKQKIIEILQQSFEHAKSAIASTPDADLEKPAKFFGENTTVRGVLVNIVVHQHEHLGQSIAYARMNGIVPPWTVAEQATQSKPTQ